MKLTEFQDEYQKLVSIYPNHFKNPIKEEMIAKFVMDLDAKWWAAVVKRIVLSSNPNLNIEDVARGERLAKQSQRLTADMIKASEVLGPDITDAGYQSALKQFNANSLLDAVFKKPREA